MARPSKYPHELPQRAVRLVRESKGEYRREFEAIRSIAGKLGIGSLETLRKWVRRAEIDGGQWPGKTSDELADIRELTKESPGCGVPTRSSSPRRLSSRRRSTPHAGF